MVKFWQPQLPVFYHKMYRFIITEFDLIWKVLKCHFLQATSAEETVGGVTYDMNLSVWSCGKPKRVKLLTLNQTFNITVTYSEARISIIATNKVGRSAPQKIIIPPVKHLNGEEFNVLLKSILIWWLYLSVIFCGFVLYWVTDTDQWLLTTVS